MTDIPSGFARDPVLFDEFYRATVHDVERFIARRVTDPHVVADLTADCFVAMIEHAADYQPRKGSPRAWAFGIARHVVQDHQRRHGSQLRAVSRFAGRALLDAPSEEDLVSRIDAEAEARTQLSRIQHLPPAERELLELVAVDGLSLAEASQSLGLRQATARVRLHRARAHLSVPSPDPEESLPCPSR